MEKGFPRICSLQDITQSIMLCYGADSLQMYFVYVYLFLKWFYLLIGGKKELPPLNTLPVLASEILRCHNELLEGRIENGR